MYRLVIHGGCSKISDDQKEQQREALEEILKQGSKALADGQSAEDVVQICVEMLEGNPIFNAGRGSALTSSGEVEMDAAIMRGYDLELGSVSCVSLIKNPIKAARVVMDYSKHSMFVGQGAFSFVLPYLNKEEQFKEQEYFETALQREKLEEALKEGKQGSGTVGVAALDVYGSLAAGTSTGGTPGKTPGRLGDSSIAYAGTLADDEAGAAVSCTGIGEHFIRTGLAGKVANSVENGQTAQEATDKAIKYLVKRINGLGAVITVDKDGNFGVSHSTPTVSAGHIDETGDMRLYI